MTRGEHMIAAAFGAIMLTYAALFHYRAPYFDHWDLAPLLEAAQSGTLRPADFFVIHGGHWHASAYALLVPAAQLTGWSHLVESVLSALFAGATCILALRLGHSFRTAAAPEMQPALFAVATAFISLSLDQASNLLWGFQLSVFVSQFGAMLALWALQGARLGALRLGLALAGLGVSVTAYATGFALIPLGVVVIALRTDWTRGLRVGAAGVWAVAGIVLCVAFLAAQQTAPHGGGFSAADLARPDFAAFLTLFELNFLGAGAARFTTDLVVPVALAAMIAAGACTYILTRAGVALRVIAIPLALCAFGIGAGLLCGLGRYDFGADQGTNSRYISFSAPFWLGAAWLILAALAHVRLKLARRALFGLVAVLALLKLGNSIQAAVKHVGLSQEIAGIAEDMRADPGNAAQAARRIAFERQDVEAHVTFLREKHWSAFR